MKIAGKIFNAQCAFFKGALFCFSALSLATPAQAQITLPYSGTVTSSSTAFGIANNGSGDGIYGYSYGGNGITANSSGASKSGVYGVSQTNGYGVVGYTTSGPAGVSGSGGHTGVAGGSASASDAGVYGVNAYGSGSGVGVWGENTQGYAGVYGKTSSTQPSFSSGVYGVTTGNGNGVAGTAYGAGAGVWAQGAGGSSYGVYAFSGATGTAAVYGNNSGGSADAGLFFGDVHISGALYATSKFFFIDDPLDPANKFLVHASVESPDRMNIYTGVTQLNSNGTAIVILPAYFQSLNSDFRYQLTCLGGFAPVYVSEEISNNQFSISGGTPGLRVSWAVTGVRQDVYALAHPLVAEIDKPEAQKGKYISPQEFGLPIEKGIDYFAPVDPGNPLHADMPYFYYPNLGPE